MKTFQKLVLAASVSAICQSAIAADAYDLIDLGELSDSENPSIVYDLNNNNNATGYVVGPFVDLLDSDNNPVVDESGDVVTYIQYLAGYLSNGSSFTQFETFEDTNDNGAISIVFGINNNDISVGYSIQEYTQTSEDSEGNEVINILEQERAVYFDVSGQITAIPELVEDRELDMRALSINDNGIIVGFGLYDRPDDVDADGELVEFFANNGFIYDSVNDSITIATPLSEQAGIATVLRDINNNGVIVGRTQVNESGTLVSTAFYSDLNSLDTPIEIKPFSENAARPFPFNTLGGAATSVNEAGVITGRALDSSERYFTAYAYDIENESAIDIGVLNPDLIDTLVSFNLLEISIANDINDLDNGSYQVVGSSAVDTQIDYTNINNPRRVSINHAFLYENETLKDLNNLIDCKQDNSAPGNNPDWILNEARAINDNGVIVGNGINNGVSKAFMLIPKAAGETPIACEVEEEEDSGSLSILTLLLAPLALWRRRFKKAAVI